jgi:hypothetical protein
MPRWRVDTYATSLSFKNSLNLFPTHKGLMVVIQGLVSQVVLR